MSRILFVFLTAACFATVVAHGSDRLPSLNEEFAVSEDASLQRSCPTWYGSADALWLRRDVGNTTVVAQTRVLGGAGQGVLVGSLTSDSIDYDFVAGAEITLGRRLGELFAFEGTFTGFQEWDESAVLPLGAGAARLSGSPLLFAAGPTQPFDLIAASFSSRLYGSELNIRRRFGTEGPLSLIAGVRYFYFDDMLTVTAANAGAFVERTEVATYNNLIGFQIGGEGHWNVGRFELGLTSKAAVLGAVTHQEMRNNVSTAVLVPPIPGVFRYLDVDQDSGTVAGMVEFGASLAFHVTDHLFVRGGYHLLLVNGVALAPEQITLVGSSAAAGDPVTNANIPGDVNDSGVLILQGVFVGGGFAW